MYRIAVFNLKGGVGKTTTTVNLAYEAANQGYKTIIWDLDPQGAATWYFSEHKNPVKTKKLINGKLPVGNFIEETVHPNLSLVPASVSQRHADILLRQGEEQGWGLQNIVSALSETYELLIVDCPPSFSVLAEQVIEACEIVICPTIPSPLSVNTVESMYQLFKKSNLDKKKLHILFSLVDLRRKTQKETLQNPPETFINRFKDYIPYNTELERMALNRTPLKAYSPNHAIVTAYENILDEAMTAIQNRRPDLYQYRAAGLATHLE